MYITRPGIFPNRFSKNYHLVIAADGQNNYISKNLTLAMKVKDSIISAMGVSVAMIKCLGVNMSME